MNRRGVREAMAREWMAREWTLEHFIRGTGCWTRFPMGFGWGEGIDCPTAYGMVAASRRS